MTKTKQAKPATQAPKKTLKNLAKNLEEPKAGDDTTTAAQELVASRRRGAITVTVDTPRLQSLAQEIVDHTGSPEAARGYVQAAQDLREGRRLQSALAPRNDASLREQYRAALETERRAAARRKNAKDEVDHYEDALLRSRRNVPFDENRYLELTKELGDRLEKFQDRKAKHDEAKKAVKAAAIQYLSTIDEEN